VYFILVSIQDTFSFVSLYRELLISGHNFIVSYEELASNVSFRRACIYCDICFGLKLKFRVLKTKMKSQANIVVTNFTPILYRKLAWKMVNFVQSVGAREMQACLTLVATFADNACLIY